MAEPEARIVINHSLTDTPREREGDVRKRARDVEKQVRARRAQIHDQAEREVRAGRDFPQDQQPTEPPPPREDLESIEFQLPDGRNVEYGPPKGISLTDRIIRLYGGRDAGLGESRLARILLGVRSIDGKKVDPITNEVDRTRLANIVGDDGIDLLFHYDRLYWPPFQPTELPVVKKNLR